MGAASSKVDNDRTLQLCRERKKVIRQALDGRCALAAAHVAYIHSLRVTGTALRKFVPQDAPVESSLYTSTNATPEPLALTEKSNSRFSFSSPTVSQRVEQNGHLSPSPSPPSGRYQVHHMKFRGGFTKKVEEKPPVVVTGTIDSLSTPPHEQAEAEASVSESPTHEPETPPWDFFGLSHPIDTHFSFREQDGARDFGSFDDLRHARERLDNDIPQVEDVEGDVSCHESQRSESEDEFDADPSSDTLVRSFRNLNREESHDAAGASPSVPTAGSTVSENDLGHHEEKTYSPKLSPLKTKSSEAATFTPDAKATPKATPKKEDSAEHKIAPKDLFSSMRDVEYLFAKASESGKEVPRMLEANKLHFRPLLPGQEPGASTTSTLLKSCFSCGEDPSQVREAEPAQPSVKYLTWHRTTSSRSSSSRNPLGPNARDDPDDLTGDIFESFCMNSGSHASTLDRLFAWERKLYDEVKASQLVRREYDMKCKLLRKQESECESQNRIDKTRAVVKDLHSRIRVAIHRIDTISRKIEELRDKELQPQLEELIEGLKRMWEVMSECHKLQVHIITIAYNSGTTKFPLHSDSHRHAAADLEDILSSLSSTFASWINALRTYVEAIYNWLRKCVFIEEKSTKKRRFVHTTTEQKLRASGPPIYTTCGVWLDLLKEQPVKEVVDMIKSLADEVSRFVPTPQEKTHGKKNPRDPALEMLNPHHHHDAFDDWNTSYDRFRSGLVIFLNQMSIFAERSVKMYTQLQTNIAEAKRQFEHKMSQP